MASKRIFFIMTSLLLVVSTYGFAADKQQFCNNYADIAVGQYTLGKENHLPGIIPPRWSDNLSGHYRWCMQVPESFANSETAKRRAHLDQYLSNILSAKKVSAGQKVGSAIKKNGSVVAATPISIPRPIKVKTQEAVVQKTGYITLRDIKKAALISLDGNTLRVRLSYRVEPSIADKLYAGAFLYNADMQAINAGYKPTQELKFTEGDVEVSLILPEEPFRAETVEVFLIHSGKVVVKKYFKLPLTWNGTKGGLVYSAAKADSGAVNNQIILPVASKVAGGWGKQSVSAGHGLPVGLDPGRGP